MYSAFSKLLIQRRILCWEAKRKRKFPEHLIQKIKISDVIKWMNANNVNNVPQVLYCNTVPELQEEVDKAMYETCFVKVMELSKWITEKLVLTIAQDNYITTNVKIRIAVDMMNKLEYEGILSKHTTLVYFNNIISNIKKLQGDVMMDDLPFLGSLDLWVRSPHYPQSADARYMSDTFITIQIYEKEDQ